MSAHSINVVITLPYSVVYTYPNVNRKKPLPLTTPSNTADFFSS
ncbi:hypothetical protein PLIP_a3468 [Pseudoalteromonas lipolytica LMEB 39]|nr:hypothetical protein [Pseudoalteromonas lipolytica LMEB 39]